MTNAEKFYEVFGIEIDPYCPDDPCGMVNHDICIEYCCEKCPIDNFWKKEYQRPNKEVLNG